MKGAVSAQKALQGSKTETRELLGGTEEMISSVGPFGGKKNFEKETVKFLLFL